MIPLGLCSIVGLAVVFERLFAFRREKVVPGEVVHASERYWRRGDFEAALRVYERFDVPLARILRAGRRHLGIDEMERAMVGTGQHESSVLGRNLRALGVIANLAPMLGFFGTVIGMLSAFEAIGRAGTVTPSLVAAGISEALITTVAGLAVGIPALAGYHYLRSRADRLIFEMENIALDLLDALVVAQTPGRAPLRPAVRAAEEGAGPAGEEA
jgi:biopolymer transport protein ExbB